MLMSVYRSAFMFMLTFLFIFMLPEDKNEHGYGHGHKYKLCHGQSDINRHGHCPECNDANRAPRKFDLMLIILYVRRTLTWDPAIQFSLESALLQVRFLSYFTRYK